MEEKLLEIMDKNEKSLNKDKEELQKVIEEEIDKHKVEFKEGKFSKTTEHRECEQDLTKIEQELDNIEEDREILREKQEKEEEISEEKKIVKNLTINKKECEEAIKEEQGKYSFSEGKFTKTPVLLEYERDLEKINRELNSKLIGIMKKEKELKPLKSLVDKMMIKYNVKARIEEKKEIKTENKQEKVAENEFVYKNSPKNEQEKITPTTFENVKKIQDVEKEMQMQNRDYKNIDLEPTEAIPQENINLGSIPKVDFKNLNKQEEVDKKIKKEEKEIKTEDNKVKFEVGPYLGKENKFVDKNSSKNEEEKIVPSTFETVKKIQDVEKEEKDNMFFKAPKIFHSAVLDDKGEIIPPSVAKSEEDNENEEKKKKLIVIQEYEGYIRYCDEDNCEKILDIEDVLENSKENFKNLRISKKCREIAGGIIKGALLKRKINPEIVEVLKDDEEQLKEYISCIKDKKELPFKLIHDLENLKIVEKLLLNKFTKAEEKSNAVILGKIFDKNRALNSAKANELKEIMRPKNIKKNAKSFVEKVYNKDSRIEANAKEALEQKGRESNLDNKDKEIEKD